MQATTGSRVCTLLIAAALGAGMLSACSAEGTTGAATARSTAQLASAPPPTTSASVDGSAAPPSSVAPAMTPSDAAAASGGASATPACENLVATAQVKAAVTQAHRAWAHLDHIEPVPGGFYYGRCGHDEYAGTAFEPAPNGTYKDKVALQDDGASTMYYARTGSGSWRHVASSGFGPDAVGCTKLPQIPHQLAVLWRDCPDLR